MKIDLGGAVASQAVLESSNKKLPSTSNSTASSSISQDRTTFSSGSSVKSLVGQAMNTPAVRQEKVDALRQSVSNGDYKVDANKIANAIASAGGF
jgi:negative regulator of flagellin synthesis FlgM